MSDPRIKPRVPKVNPEHPLAKGLVAAYPFFDGGGTDLQDITARGLSGAVSGTPEWSQSRYGKALNFDGVGDRVVSSNDALLNPATAVSVSVWVRANSDWSLGTAITGIVSKGLFPLPGHTFSLAGDPGWFGPVGEFDFWVFTGAFVSHGVHSGVVPVPGQWYHIVGTYGAAGANYKQRIYVDGVLKDEAFPVSALYTMASDLDIGHSSYFGGYLDGALADVRIWNRALLPGEVESLYYDPWSLYRGPEPVLAGAPGGFFQFDQLTGGMPDLRGGMV